MSDMETTDSSGQRIAAYAFAAFLVLAGGGYAVYWAMYARYFESTDNAYVSGNVVQVSSPVAGRVISIAVDDTQLVKAGQPLVGLDPTDAKVALMQAEGALAQAVRQVRTLYANNEQYTSVVRSRESDVAQAEAALERRQTAGGAISKEEVERARVAVNGAKEALLIARAQQTTNLTLAGNTPIAEHPSIIQASALLRAAYLAVARSSIPSPVDGYVAQRSVQLGQLVGPGSVLMAVVPLNQVWVDANFTEIRLKHLRLGQTVKLVADLYGPEIPYRGTVVGFSPGTGSAFSLLPAQNATGNWIKVVQRLPVRIMLDPAELAAHPLRVGLSMHATIDLRDQTGKDMAAAPVAHPYQTDVYGALSEQADALVAKVIGDSMGNEKPQPAAAPTLPNH